MTGPLLIMMVLAPGWALDQKVGQWWKPKEVVGPKMKMKSPPLDPHLADSPSALAHSLERTMTAPNSPVMSFLAGRPLSLDRPRGVGTKKTRGRTRIRRADVRGGD